MATRATVLAAVLIGAGLLTIWNCSESRPHPAPPEPLADAGTQLDGGAVLPGLKEEAGRVYVLPPEVRDWTVVRNGNQLAIEWGEQSPEYLLKRVNLPLVQGIEPIKRFHHPTTWASSTQWLQMHAGMGTYSVAVFEGISLERFGDEYGALLPDGGFAWYGRCDYPDQPQLSGGDRDGEAWWGSGSDCFHACAGMHQTSLWRISEPGDAGFVPLCLFPEVSGPKDIVLHPNRRLGAASLYPVYPGPRMIRLFEFDETGVTAIAPDISTASASPIFWPLGRRLLFPVLDPNGSPSDPKRVRQVDWIGDELVQRDRLDLGAIFRDLKQYAWLSGERVAVVGDALDATVLTPTRLVALLEHDEIVGSASLPKASRYVFWSLGDRNFVFWEVRVELADGGTSAEIWGQELVFLPAPATDAGP